MHKINPKKIRFIKLGTSGEWEKDCISKNTLRIGYISPYHKESLLGNWEILRRHWLTIRNGNEGAATRDIIQIREFYESSEEDVWITFYQRKLYWCRAQNEVIELEDGSRIRRVIGQWSCNDILGNVLHIENLDGRVSKVQGFRGTVCGVDQQEYLIRKINGEDIEAVTAAKQMLKTLTDTAEDLIKGLWWHDFELLIDLVFSKAGWQRFSVVGKTEKDIDLDLFSPTTQRRAFVQIKTATTAKQFHEYLIAFREYDKYDEMYYVYHTSSDSLETLIENESNVHLWGVQRIAQIVVSTGLMEWLINKRG
jgi:hypothetical protein